MDYISKLKKIIKRNRSNVVIGLDTDIKKIPLVFKKYKNPVFEFNKRIINLTSQFVTGYKINVAFYESSYGYETLEKLSKLFNDRNVFISDAKRGDIDNSAQYYADYHLGKLNFDAITISPYMGIDAVEPFFKMKDKYVYLLALTSNRGSKDFQKLKTGNKFLYEVIIEKSMKWADNIGFVFGANYPKEINKFTRKNKNVSLLIPGIGAQNNDLENLIKNIKNDCFVINSSRGIIYSSAKNSSLKEFDKSILNSVNILNTQINILKYK
ncbi:MAG TPA: orotidine-5'-phosphate decarboxylase [Bacteroidetes bacterium]|nr:orotidine-5'-phosphate decarboxylase [Bacteroidota bacterium]